MYYTELCEKTYARYSERRFHGKKAVTIAYKKNSDSCNSATHHQYQWRARRRPAGCRCSLDDLAVGASAWWAIVADSRSSWFSACHIALAHHPDSPTGCRRDYTWTY